jgi:hypothetical protein
MLAENEVAELAEQTPRVSDVYAPLVPAPEINTEQVRASQTLDDVIEQGEVAAERFNKSREQILPMARGLAAAKRKYPATRKFNEWLEGSPYSRIGASDRAALINIGEQLDEHEGVIIQFLAGTNLVSPQTIWTEIKKEVWSPLSSFASCYPSKSKDESAAANPAAEKKLEPKAGGTRPTTAAAAAAGAEAPEESWSSGGRFNLVLITPSDDELKHLRADYADPETLKRCLPLHRVIEDDVAVIIDTKIGDLPVITSALLPLAGFTPAKRPRVLIVGQPQAPDISDARVLVAIERGVEFSAPKGWLDDADAVGLAEQLYRDVSRSLRVFASTDADGWQCRTWLESPSVR